jgi:hypothetical protein
VVTFHIMAWDICEHGKESFGSTTGEEFLDKTLLFARSYKNISYEPHNWKISFLIFSFKFCGFFFLKRFILLAYFPYLGVHAVA